MSGSGAARTPNRLPGTKVPVWLLTNSLRILKNLTLGRDRVPI
jgi:hypothetical protein